VRSANASLATVWKVAGPVRKEQRGARTAQSFASYTQRATWRPYCLSFASYTQRATWRPVRLRACEVLIRCSRAREDLAVCSA